MSAKSESIWAPETSRANVSKTNLQHPPLQNSELRQPIPLQKILGVRLPKKHPSDRFDITLSNGRIGTIEPHITDDSGSHRLPGTLDASDQLLAPSLCHAHIHLDKCFLLQNPRYGDLEIITGSFDEAMNLTTQAKLRFQDDDLLHRGRQLIEESIGFGVTSMHAFVEVDEQVHLKCLEAGLKLKGEYQDRCHIQICAFAQLPLFSGDDGGETIRRLMEEAVRIEGVDVVGSTPYVEKVEDKMKRNVRWISTIALQYNKFLDLHMDYHLDKDKPAFSWTALDIIKEGNWKGKGGKGISLGHCTRLSLFGADEWNMLKSKIGDLPIYFVGLPTSDIFMMRTQSGVRGTLPIPRMIRDYKLDAAIAVNNVGNAFTPHGSCDPLSVACLGVGLYQTATKQDTELLYVSSPFHLQNMHLTVLEECVSSRAKASIGVGEAAPELVPGALADFVIFPQLGWRTRKSIAEAVYDPGFGRQTIFKGRLVTY
jgi:cytosine/adenosine deaminase-related metal-dependent hydrolase